MSAPAGEVTRPRLFLRRNLPLLVSGLCIVAILIAGSTYNTNFLSAGYLISQLQVAAFLGIVAAGSMLVILIGHIDLSVPWTLAACAMLSTGFGGHAALGAGSVPIALGVGALVGLLNGVGVSYLRVPSMIFTLGVNAVLEGLMVLYTGGSAPSSSAEPIARYLSNGHLLPRLPNAVLCWAVVAAAMTILLRSTIFGRTLYAIGNRERAAFLCGLPVRRVVLLAFTGAGCLSGLSGLLLSGYAGKAYQGMGDTYLLPAIASVVLGGTSIMGGSGRYVGTIVGTILIVLLQSMLAVMQMPDAGRQIIYGLVIFAMVLLYGRSPRLAG